MHTSAHDACESPVSAFDSGDDIPLSWDSPSDYLPEQIRPVDRQFSWRLANQAEYAESHHLQLKIQSFKSGGYEGTVRWVDLQKMADMQTMPRRIGTRTEPEERSQEPYKQSSVLQ